MLSPKARSLLKIPHDAQLPTDLGTLYDHFFAGRSYHTRFRDGWTFSPRGHEVKQGLDFCLDHYTAPFHSCLDSEFRVYMIDDSAAQITTVQIATNFISLVERDALVVDSVAMRPLGTFPSYDAFFAVHGDYVKGWAEADFPDKAFRRFFTGRRSVVELIRCYDDEHSISAMEHFY